MKIRLMSIALLASVLSMAQMPRALRPWWNGKIVRDLGLSQPQLRQLRMTVREYSPRLLEARAAVQRGETDLEAAFNDDNVDANRANQAIENLANARATLTRTLSQMELKLRQVLTPQQWRELQKRRAQQADGPPEPPTRN